MRRFTYLPLILILFLGFFLRFYQLGSLPTILNRDEAALAYNALLIDEVEKDEWQESTPLTFKSFGDYKLPGYIYLLSFLYKFLPANDLLVRLPSALAGLALVYLTYLWAKDLFKLRKRYALFASFIVAVLPIFTFYSRIAFEANLALSLFVAGLYFLLQKKNSWLLAIFFFTLAILTYNTALLLLPFIIFYLLVINAYDFYKKKTFTFSRQFSIIALLLLFFVAGFYLFQLSQQKAAITIFTDPTTWSNYLLYRENLSTFLLPILGSKYVYYLIVIINNIAKSFSWQFLVSNGGSHPWHSVPYWGHLFTLSYFLALLGMGKQIFAVYKELLQRKLKQDSWSFLYLLLIGLAPAVVTVDAPHATRSLFFFFILTLFAALGAQWLENLIQSKNLKKYFLSSLVFIISLEAIIYQQRYFTVFTRLYDSSLWPAYRDLIRLAERRFPDKKIAIIDPGGYQYILTAWYLKMSAEEFFSSHKKLEPDSINFSYGEYLGRYHFIKDKKDITGEELIISEENWIEAL